MGDSSSFIKSTLIEYFTENKASFMNFDLKKITEKRGGSGRTTFAVVELKLSREGVASAENLSATKLIIEEPYKLAFWSDGTGGQISSGSLILKNSNGEKVFESSFKNSTELKDLLKDVFPDINSLEEKNELESIKEEINYYTIESIDSYVWDLQASIRILWKLIQTEHASYAIKFKPLITDYLNTLFTKVYKEIIERMPTIVTNATIKEYSIPEKERAVQILKSEIESILERLKEIKENIGNGPNKTKLGLICDELETLRKMSDY